MSLGETKNKFSLRYKLIIIFGLLILLAGSVLGTLSLRIARKAVVEKVETHLTDKATDVADIMDAKISAFFQFIEGIARMPQIQETNIPMEEKLQFLQREASFNNKISDFELCDMDGIWYTIDGKLIDVSDRDWYKSAVKGKLFMSEPVASRSSEKLVIACSVPVYDNNRRIVGVLLATVNGTELCNEIKGITVGKTGFCYIISQTGVTVAHQDKNVVAKNYNLLEDAKTNPDLASTAEFLHHALGTAKSDVGYYTYNGSRYIASFAVIPITGWTVIIRAPAHEFMGTISTLRISILITGIVIFIVTMVTTYIVAYKMIHPIQSVVRALQNIAQGEGDLTVRLPVLGSDEVTDLSAYFNETIEKIGFSIKAVGANSDEMEEIGSELASNMSQTASSIHEISANINSMKQQALTQAGSVTETAATIEQILKTIKRLNSSIETQAASVVQSSASVEQMVANIGTITKTLETTDDVIKKLASATRDGKDTIATSNKVTQKIAEESGGLLEASSVIQHIASQTNLLAMNAAIEAAHAGEAGKGFAVVADEIRKLAEDSAAQGKTITSTLKALSGEIEMLSASSKTAEEKFSAIFSLSEQVRAMSDQLTEAMREQENGSREVLTAIKSINTVTIEVSDGSAEMLTGGEGVAEEMNKLNNLTQVITESMNEMAAGAVQINNAVQEVNEISKKNKQSIESLACEVSKFKV